MSLPNLMKITDCYGRVHYINPAMIAMISDAPSYDDSYGAQLRLTGEIIFVLESAEELAVGLGLAT